MPPLAKAGYHHGNLREALIQSGLEILAREGIDKLSLRKVAREAGVSEAAPYRHFKDKEALIASIAEQGFMRLAERLEQVEAAFANDARTLFYQSSKAYIQYARENPDAMRVMFRPRPADGLEAFPGLREASGEAFSYLLDMVEYCQQTGLARAGHPMPLALGIWSAIHGLSILLIDGYITEDHFQGMDEDTMITTSLDRILQGWQPSVSYSR